MRPLQLFSTAAFGLLAGCTTGALQADYGRSVHQMIEYQTAVPGAGRAAGAAVVQGANADMIDAAVKQVQTDVGKGQDMRDSGYASNNSMRSPQ